MEVTAINFIELKLFNTIEENEVEQFMNFIRRAYIESSRAGLKNTFEQDRSIIKKLMEEFGIVVETTTTGTAASDTHTSQQYNDQ